MDEFIVWDKKSKKFRCLSSIVYDTTSKHDIEKEDIDIKLVNCWGSVNPCYDDGECNPDILIKREKGQFTLHKAIGKTDINKKKIYANCSIVEFDYDNLNGYFNKVKGYFYQDEWQIRLKVLDSETYMGVDNLSMAYQNPKDLKIIDTIQQNKLGIIK